MLENSIHKTQTATCEHRNFITRWFRWVKARFEVRAMDERIIRKQWQEFDTMKASLPQHRNHQNFR